MDESLTHGWGYGRPDQIERLHRLWTDEEGGRWLVTFELLRLDDRLECVGLSVRSYVRCLVLDEDGVYETFARPSATRDEIEEGARGLDPEEGPAADALYVEYGMNQELAIRELGNRGMPPTPLKSVTLRALPLYGELSRARRDSAKGWRQVAEGERHMGRSSDSIEGYADALDRPRDMRGRGRGRPPKYSPHDLARVASIYNAAWRAGSRSPVKDVREALGLTQSVAEKLVARCRRDSLIPPSEGRQRPPD